MATRDPRDGDSDRIHSVSATVMRCSPRSLVVVSEAALIRHARERIRRQSAYIAGVIWIKRCHGLLADEQAGLELDRLAAAGLDPAVLRSTYADLARAGVPPALLDFDEQISTLHQFLPGALASSDAADAA